jgi:hypothetical protein
VCFWDAWKWQLIFIENNCVLSSGNRIPHLYYIPDFSFLAIGLFQFLEFLRFSPSRQEVIIEMGS